MIEKNPRKDKLKNKAKVIREIAKDPTLTEREVAKKTGLSNGGVHGHLKEIEQNGAGSQIMDRILEKDDQIIELVNSLTFNHIKRKVEEGKKLESNEVKTLGDMANNSTKRKAIFGDTGDRNKTVQFILS